MKPLQNVFPFSTWLMRVGVVFFTITRYAEIFLSFNSSSRMFYLASIFLLFSFLLFLGGFFKKHSLTVISSIFLILATGYQSFIILKAGIDYNFAVYVVLGSVFFYFLSKGNSQK